MKIKRNNYLTIITIIVFFINIFASYHYKQISYIFTKKVPISPYVISNRIDNYCRQTLAFSKGQIAFLDDAKYLTNLKNPYNPGERIKYPYLFDTGYYKGNYYSNYSIIPIIFVLLPIYLISGYFFNIAILTIINLALICYFVGKIYHKIIEQYIPKLPLFFYILGYLTIIFGANMFILIRGLKYDLQTSCGILFIVLTLYMITLLNNNKYIKLKLILTGIFTSFIVLSKPSYIIYYILIFYFMYLFLKKLKIKKYILFYIFPIILFALFQMWYNYVRYDSIFEFGAKYQLTGFNILDYYHFSFNRFIRGIKFYLFQIPRIDIHQFPYIFINTNYDNHLYTEFLYEGIVCGLLYHPCILLFILTIITNNNIRKKVFNNVAIILGITFLLICAINTSFAGVIEYYILDFKFVAMLFSVIYLLKKLDLQNYNKKSSIIITTVFILNILLILPISYAHPI